MVLKNISNKPKSQMLAITGRDCHYRLKSQQKDSEQGQDLGLYATCLTGAGVVEGMSLLERPLCGGVERHSRFFAFTISYFASHNHSGLEVQLQYL